MERADDYFPIRKNYFELSGKEREEQQEHAPLRERLNKQYDTFTAKWGLFHDNDNKEFIMLDSFGVEVFTLEMQVGKDIFKADIMREPIAFKKTDKNAKQTIAEALASSLNLYYKVDLSYIEKATGTDNKEIIKSLTGKIFYNLIVREWEHKDKFLAGNVIAKSKEIRSAMQKFSGAKKEWADEVNRWLDDERSNLDNEVDGVIVAFADLELWHGHTQGYRIIGSNVADILRSKYDAEWYGDTCNIRGGELHHDGTNHIYTG